MTLKHFAQPVALFSLLTATSVHGAITFTDAATFVSNLQSGYYLNDFESLTAGYNNPPLAFSQGGFSYSASVNTGKLWANQTNFTYTHWMSTSTINATMVLSFTSGNVTAVGTSIFVTNINEAAVAGSITATLNDGTLLTLDSVTSGSQPFAGFTTSIANPITSLTLTTGVANGFVSIDDLYVGAVAAVAPVPEAGTFAICLAPLFLGLIMRRRR